MWEVRADGERLLAQFGNRGPVFVMAPDGSVAEQLRPLDILEPMVPLDEAVDDVLEMIRDVPLAKAARVALAKALDVEPEDVGTAPARKPKEGVA
jgi:hypothetical protein